MKARSTLWVYKNNSNGEDYQRSSGDWAELFDQGQSEWGRSGWFKPESTTLIEQDVAVGDQFLCHQTNRRSWVGIADIVEMHPVPEGVALILRPAVRFTPELRIATVKQQFPVAGYDGITFESISAFRPAHIATIYELSQIEQRLIRKLVRPYVTPAAVPVTGRRVR